jgi:hypothetical protein
MCSKTYPSRPKKSPIEAIASTADMMLGKLPNSPNSSTPNTFIRNSNPVFRPKEVRKLSSETHNRSKYPKRKEVEVNTPRKKPPEGVLFL